jgi:transposase-like protein
MPPSGSIPFRGPTAAWGASCLVHPRQWLLPFGANMDAAALATSRIRSDQNTVILLALGVDAHGTKHVLASRTGTTENATVCKELLADARRRGLDLDRPTLFVIDGGTALRKAIRETSGAHAIVQRCQVHQARNAAPLAALGRTPTPLRSAAQSRSRRTPGSRARRPSGGSRCSC